MISYVYLIRKCVLFIAQQSAFPFYPLISSCQNSKVRCNGSLKDILCKNEK